MKIKVLGLLTAIVLAVGWSPPLMADEPTIQPLPQHPSAHVPPHLPDLVVTFFTQEGSARVAGDHVEVRAALGVKNQGNAPAGRFKVAVECTVEPAPERPRSGLRSGPFVVPFSGDGPVEWYAYVEGPLAPGGSGYFKRKVIFPPGVRGMRVTLRAIADSCTGDEFQPAYCRVKESNEGNNTSTPITMSLP